MPGLTVMSPWGSVGLDDLETTVDHLEDRQSGELHGAVELGRERVDRVDAHDLLRLALQGIADRVARSLDVGGVVVRSRANCVLEHERAVPAVGGVLAGGLAVLLL